MNRSNFLFHISEDADLTNNPLPSDIPISRVGFNLLSSPIGPPSFWEAMMLKRVEVVKIILSRLTDLQDSLMETTLFRSCLALPKVAFPLCTCLPCHTKQAAAAFDHTMEEVLADLDEGPMLE